MQANHANALDAGFSNLKAMVADLGESFSPQHHDLSELMEDTRATLDDMRHSHRQRMKG